MSPDRNRNDNNSSDDTDPTNKASLEALRNLFETAKAESREETDITAIADGIILKDAIEKAQKAPPALVCLFGPPRYQGKRWVITKGELVIGRALQSDIFIDERSLSKSHAMISCKGENVFVTDLDSKNSTTVNDKAVPPYATHRLRQSDHLKVGNVVLKFLEQGSLESLSHQMSYDMRLQDPLTGIFNRGALLTKAEEEFGRAVISNSSMSVIFLDLDHFKKVNDTYGHDAGDYVLKEMVRVVQEKVIRSEDFFARYGGEEFVLILQNSPLEMAEKVAERIRSTIESHEFQFEGERLAVTLSAGVASRGPDTKTWDDILKKADKACYKSKQAGRNCVSTL